MMDHNFELWFVRSFVEEVKTLEKPVLLTFDGHASHLTYNTVKAAMDNDIILLCLPPNSSHDLQPLNVGVFRSAKRTWKKVLTKWYNQSKMLSVDKAVFPILLGQFWPKLKARNAVNGFRGAGLYPSDRRLVKRRMTLQSERTSSSGSDEATPTPRKLLRKSILKVISPEPSEETRAAMRQKAERRTRIQKKHGELLTTESVLEQLREKEVAKKSSLKRKLDFAKASTSGSSTTKRKKTVAKTTAKKKVSFVEICDITSEEESSDSEMEHDSISGEEEEEKRKSSVNVSKLHINKAHVIVYYEGSQFPGVVKKIGKTGITVSCMEKSGTGWTWPKKEDLNLYPLCDVLKIIKPPELINSRGQCAVPELQHIWGQ